jgi:hypothetical protein
MLLQSSKANPILSQTTDCIQSTDYLHIWTALAESYQDEPGFPLQFGGVTGPRAAFREESRIRGRHQSSVQETRDGPGWAARMANSPFQRRRYPRIASWGIFSRPCGTGSFLEPLPRTHVLGYSQPSLRDSIWRGQFT